MNRKYCALVFLQGSPIDYDSDLSMPPIGNLTIKQQQSHPVTEPRQLRPNTRLAQNEQSPLPAPVPTRVSTAPMQPPGPVQGMWNPDIGIKFGGPGPTSPGMQSPGQKPPGSAWDPSSGIRFG